MLRNWNEIFNSDEIQTAEEYLTQAKKISKSLFSFLIANKFKENWDNIVNNSKSSYQINKQKQIWFDGFKTLKLID